MPDQYVQEPAETYGDQVAITSHLKFPYVRLGQKVIEAIPIIGHEAFVTYCVLLHFADRGGVCWPSYRTLMQLTGFGRKKLMKNLKVLVDQGLADRSQMRKGKEFGANRYTLLSLDDWEPKHASMVVPIWHHQETPKVTPLEVPILDRQDLDRQDLHHKLDPVLTRSSLKLEKREERAREDFEIGEAEEEIFRAHCLRCGQVLPSDMRCQACGAQHEVLDEVTLRRTSNETGEAEEDEGKDESVCPDDCEDCAYEREIVDSKVHDHAAAPPTSMDDGPQPCAWQDPIFPCQHEHLAMHVATEILGRPVKKSHRHLHAWVHEHSIADTTKVLEHFVTHEPNRAKWTLGLIFAPDNAEARLQAATSPPPPGKKEATDPDRPLRFAGYKPFDDAPTLPEDALPPEDAKALVSDLMKQFNAREL